MGLVNLATNLADFNYYQAKGYVGGRGNFSAKKLPYGDDEPNDGSSNQPFIAKAIPATDQPLQTGFSISGDNILQGIGSIALSAGGGALVGGIFGGGTGAIVGAAIGGAAGIIGTSNLITGDIDYTSFKIPRGGTGGTDFLIRGGTLSAGIVADDVERLSKFFATTNGALFITKQTLLSRTSVRTQASNGALNGGTYNPGSTLLQAAGNIVGLHANKQGLNPLLGLGGLYTPNQYFDIAKETNTTRTQDIQLNSININNIGNNSFSPTEILPDINISILRNRLIGLYSDFVDVNSTSQTNILSYQGGPGSFLGVGKTNIKFATGNGTNGVRTNNSSFNTVLTSTQLTETANEVLGLSIDNNEVTSGIIPKQIDFRAKLRKTLREDSRKTIMSDAPSYNPGENKTLEQRTNLGDPGKISGKNLTSYTFGVGVKGNASENSYDKINTLRLYQSSEADITKPINDLISFRIGVINNNKPELKTYIHFRAFLDSISDQYKADWKGTKYLGRGEDFYTYGGFDRSVSLSWTVAAQSKIELIPMYKKLNYLASICMPDYSEFGYMRGNIITLTIGGYFYEQPGIITGFSYAMNDDNSTWEIGIDDVGDVDETVRQVPHMIKVTGFNFIPIHNFVPRKQQNLVNASPDASGIITSYGQERYINLADKEDPTGKKAYNLL